MTSGQNPLGARTIDRILKDHPEAAPVLHRHLGASCFECPGRFEETLDLGIALHEADAGEFYSDLANAIETQAAGRSGEGESEPR